MIIDKIIKKISKKFAKTKKEQEELVFGLTFGLAGGLGDFLVNYFSISSVWIFIGIIILILAELIYWKDKTKPKKKQSKFYFTIERKIISILESMYIVGNIIGGYQLFREGIPLLDDFLKQYGLSILNFIGWGTVIVLTIFVYIYFNSLKYRVRK